MKKKLCPLNKIMVNTIKEILFNYPFGFTQPLEGKIGPNLQINFEEKK